MTLKKIILLSIPFLLFLELSCFSWITALLREASDTSVFFGVVLLSLFTGANFYLYRFITHTFKP